MEGREKILIRLTTLLSPLCELDEAGRQAIAGHARILRMPPGAALAATDENRWLTYLIKGEVDLRSSAQGVETVAAGSSRARRPLFDTSPAPLCAVTRANTILLRFDRELYRWLRNRPHPEEAAYRLVGNQLYFRAFRAWMNGTVELPRIAPSIHRLLREPPGNLKELVALLGEALPLASTFVSAVNGGERGPRVSTVSEAVMRLGLAGSRSLAAVLAIRPLFRAATPVVQRQMHQLYSHTLLVGSLCYTLARHRSGVAPHRALLAGLTHDLGVLPVLVYADRNPAPEITGMTLESAARRLKLTGGAVVLRRLGFDTELCRDSEIAERWYRGGEGLPDQGDLLVLAHLLLASGSPEERRLPPFDRVPAFRKWCGGDGESRAQALHALQAARNMAAMIHYRTA